MDPDPYAAPLAALENPVPAGAAGLLPEPRKVAAGQGVEWFAQGWKQVLQAPGAWIGVFFLLLVAMLVLSFVPFGANLLMPVLVAGLALGCEAQRQGHGFEVDSLFASFRSPQLGQLLLVGVLTLVATLLLLVVLLPLMFLAIALAGGLSDPAGQGNPPAAIAIFVMFFAVIALAMIPLTLATVFAPMLVALHGVPALESMKLSLRGGLRNIGAAGVALVMYLVVAVLATLPCLLGWILAMPVLIAANYAAYRDIFCER